MRNSAIVILLALLSVITSIAQDWKQVHKKDEAKWAKATGLDPTVIHKIWRMASSQSDEKDDDSRIADLDLEGLAERHDVLLVTYAGEKNCLTLTVFRQLSETKFSKVWSLEPPSDGTGFCDSALGSPQADAANGMVRVRVPLAGTDGSVQTVMYVYEWNGITYRFAGKKELNGE